MTLAKLIERLLYIQDTSYVIVRIKTNLHNGNLNRIIYYGIPDGEGYFEENEYNFERCECRFNEVSELLNKYGIKTEYYYTHDNKVSWLNIYMNDTDIEPFLAVLRLNNNKIYTRIMK